METINIHAMWTVKLNCTCPKCDEWVDLLDYADFWDQHYSHLKIAEEVKDLEVMCPECGHEFKVITSY